MNNSFCVWEYENFGIRAFKKIMTVAVNRINIRIRGDRYKFKNS